MEFRETQAIYLQIGDWLCEQVLLGKYNAGDRIQSVRELGVALQVNPNTVMRTYDFLESTGIIYNKRGVGFFVSDDAPEKIINYRKKQFMEQELPLFFKSIRLLGMNIEDVVKRYESFEKDNAI